MPYDEKLAIDLEEQVFATAHAYDDSKKSYKQAQRTYKKYMRTNHPYVKWAYRIQVVYLSLVYGGFAALLAKVAYDRKQERKGHDSSTYEEYLTYVIKTKDEDLVMEFHRWNGLSDHEDFTPADHEKFSMVKEELEHRKIDPLEFEDPPPF